MNREPLSRYVIGVVVVLGVVISIVWFLGGSAQATKVGRFAAAFLLGMAAMYLAMHVYKHK